MNTSKDFILDFLEEIDKYNEIDKLHKKFSKMHECINDKMTHVIIKNQELHCDKCCLFENGISYTLKEKKVGIHDCEKKGIIYQFR